MPCCGGQTTKHQSWSGDRRNEGETWARGFIVVFMEGVDKAR